jgi:hypothetical protein
MVELIYIITCVDRNGMNLFRTMNINPWNGSVWSQAPAGKRKLLKRAYN